MKTNSAMPSKANLEVGANVLHQDVSPPVDMDGAVACEATKHSPMLGETVDSPCASPKKAVSVSGQAKTSEHRSDDKPVALNVVSDEWLVDTELPPSRFLVDNMIGEGLTLLTGDPKIGKSVLVYQLATNIANGTNFLNRKTLEGEVLYISLEDTYARLKNRLLTMGCVVTGSLFLAIDSPRLGEGLTAAIRQFKQEHPSLVLIIIDTLQWVRRVGKALSYENDVNEMGELKTLCKDLDISIIVVHHNNRSEFASGLAKISGTSGLAATADTILLLKRGIGSDNATLDFTGKDVSADKIYLKFRSNLTFEVDTKDAHTTTKSQPTDQIDEEPLPDELVHLCSAIRCSGGFQMVNEEFQTWLIKNVGVSDIASFKRRCNKFHDELFAMGITVGSDRESGKRYTIIKYEPSDSETQKS